VRDFVRLGVWCYVGYDWGLQPAVAQAFSRSGHSLVPFVRVGLGLLIMVQSGTFMLFNLWLTNA
jgi:cadmium resistance protein CadD (predicted permease)